MPNPNTNIATGTSSSGYCSEYTYQQDMLTKVTISSTSNNISVAANSAPGFGCYLGMAGATPMGVNAGYGYQTNMLANTTNGTSSSGYCSEYTYQQDMITKVTISSTSNNISVAANSAPGIGRYLSMAGATPMGVNAGYGYQTNMLANTTNRAHHFGHSRQHWQQSGGVGLIRVCNQPGGVFYPQPTAYGYQAEGQHSAATPANAYQRNQPVVGTANIQRPPANAARPPIERAEASWLHSQQAAAYSSNAYTGVRGQSADCLQSTPSFGSLLQNCASMVPVPPSEHQCPLPDDAMAEYTTLESIRPSGASGNNTLATPARHPSGMPSIGNPPASYSASNNRDISPAVLPIKEESKDNVFDIQLPRHRCSLCQQGFDSTKDLFEHRKSAHPVPFPFRRPHLVRNSRRIDCSNLISCDKCRNRYAHQQELERHRLLHLMHEARVLYLHKHNRNDFHRILCPFCGIEKASFAQVREHLVVHTSDRNLQCSLCGDKFFKRIRIKMEHMKRYHPLRCEGCNGRRYPNHTALRKHIRRAHKRLRGPDYAILDQVLINLVLQQIATLADGDMEDDMDDDESQQ